MQTFSQQSSVAHPLSPIAPSSPSSPSFPSSPSSPPSPSSSPSVGGGVEQFFSQSDDVHFEDSRNNAVQYMLDEQKERIDFLEQRIQQLERSYVDQSPSFSFGAVLSSIFSAFLGIFVVFALQHYFKILDLLVHGYRWDSL